MEELFDKALALAQQVTGPEKGMASVGVEYDPYEASWRAFASWSDDSRTYYSGETITDALYGLMDVLRDELARRKG